MSQLAPLLDHDRQQARTMKHVALKCSRRDIPSHASVCVRILAQTYLGEKNVLHGSSHDGLSRTIGLYGVAGLDLIFCCSGDWITVRLILMECGVSQDGYRHQCPDSVLRGANSLPVLSDTRALTPAKRLPLSRVPSSWRSSP